MAFEIEDIAAMLNVDARHVEYLEIHSRQIPHNAWMKIALAIMPTDFDALNKLRAWTDISKIESQASNDGGNA